MSNRTTPSLEHLLEHRRWVRAVARGLLRDEHAAEDLAQDAWARALRSPPDPARDPRPWLRRVLKNLASNRFRGEGRRQRRETGWRDERVQRTPAELVGEAEQHGRIVRLVLNLEEPFKTAVVLRFYDGLGPKEIAQRLGIPVGTVHSRLARAVERLKERLDGEEGGDRSAWITAFLPLAASEHFATPAAAAAVTTSFTGILLMTLTKSKMALSVFLLLGCLAGGALLLTESTSEADRELSAFGEGPDERGPSLEGRAATPRSSEASATADEAPATPRERRLVRGRVVDGRGAVVAEAEVFLVPNGSAGASLEELDDPRLRRVRTGFDGSFTIPVDDPHAVRLVVHAAGYLSASADPAAAAKGPLELVVGDPWKLAVEVSDTEGHWPRGCGLHVQSDPDTTFERAVDPSMQAFYFATDRWDVPKQSRVLIPVTSRARLRIEVQPPEGMAAVPAVQFVEHGQPEAWVSLIASGSLRLAIVDGASGASLAEGSRVSLMIRDQATGAIPHSLSTLESAFDFDTGFAPGRYVIKVGVQGYQTWEHVVQFREMGERLTLDARLAPAADSDTLGRVVLRVVDPQHAPEALRALVASGAPPGFADSYQVLVRRAQSDLWLDAFADELGDGHISLRPFFIEKEQVGLKPGIWDIFVARRDTGTAGFLKSVRIFGDQDNFIDMTLEVGTAFRLPQVVPGGARFADLTIRTSSTGTLPPILWTKDGSNSITRKSGIAWLLRLPRKAVVLGPYPAGEVEIRLTAEDGRVQTVGVRGAGMVQGGLKAK